ncbi:ATP synthase subunit 5, mitochondrial [Ceratocystis fimbriata CBS 114723]|uniref:ATP synthase subunit 5, mitochondrial n=2 Tax=Ceratocystis TaxID=5157 RepID=A0A0F8B5I1_CERFI|nr:ATP synthase subunit 5 mitochondrial [Ceratocystis platani]PHH50733.1 ATP synthase subunit 5, mitochondrial [Ceratocystis fimbriata CBS 114723]
MLSRQALRVARVAAPARAQVRTYAAAAVADSKPPVAVFGLDGTYASALYTAAVKTSSLDATAKAVASLDSLFAKDSKLGTVLSAPTLSDSDKSSIITELLKAAGTSDVTTKNFLDALAENNRLNLLEGALSKFSILMAAARGEVEMTVTSAQPLENKLLNRLESAVTKSAYVSKGQTLKVKNEVNPDILGGLIVEIGDKTIDLSVSAKVAKMNKLLTESL